MGSSPSLLLRVPALCRSEEEEPIIDNVKVVILGGGYAGMAVAALLDPHMQVVVVERKEVMVHCIAGLRALVDDAVLARDVLLPYPRVLPHGGLRLEGEAEWLDPLAKKVGVRPSAAASAKKQGQPPPTAAGASHDMTMREGGEAEGEGAASTNPTGRKRKGGEAAKSLSLSYDYLVVAVGRSQSTLGRGGLCLSREELLTYMRGLGGEVRRASHVVIVGGGPVGVELAAEIRHYHQQEQEKGEWKGAAATTSSRKRRGSSKTVTVVHSGAALCNRLEPHIPPCLQAQLANKLTAMGVHLHLRTRAMLPNQQGVELCLPGPRTVKLSNGRAVEADLVLMATGPPPYGHSSTNATLLAPLKAGGGGQGAGSSHEGGGGGGDRLLRTNRYLQVQGHPRVFALGDVADAEGSGLAWSAQQQARVVASNLLALARTGYHRKPQQVLVGGGHGGPAPVVGADTLRRTTTTRRPREATATSEARRGGGGPSAATTPTRRRQRQPETGRERQGMDATATFSAGTMTTMTSTLPSSGDGDEGEEGAMMAPLLLPHEWGAEERAALGHGLLFSLGPKAGAGYAAWAATSPPIVDSSTTGGPLLAAAAMTSSTNTRKAWRRVVAGGGGGGGGGGERRSGDAKGEGDSVLLPNSVVVALKSRSLLAREQQGSMRDGLN